MFVLECLHKDADLFFEMLNQKNTKLHTIFKRTDFKYHSKIVCLYARPQYSILTFEEMDIKECLLRFRNSLDLYVYKLLADTRVNIVSSIRTLRADHTLKACALHADILKYRVDWKLQQSRVFHKQFLKLTG